MIDILLIHPDYPWANKYPPMGLLYLSSYLEKHSDLSVKMVDLAIQKEFESDPFFIMQKEKPAIVGISFMTPQSPVAYAIADVIRREFPNTTLISGGFHASALPAEALEHFDFVVIGEGEETLRELAQHIIFNKNSLEAISGIAYRQNGFFRMNKPRKPLCNLNDLPFPAWHQLPLERYNGLGMGLETEKPFMVILSSRGCPNQCIFCASHIVHGTTFRMRSPDNIIDEIKILKRHFNIEQFDFADDTMTVSKKRMTSFCKKLIEQNLSINWDCNARVNTVDGEMLRIMKKAGCKRVNFGVESGDQGILDAIKKGITIKQAKRAHRLAKDVGLMTMSFFMIGNPGEGERQIDNTLLLAKELSPDFPGLTFCTPYPGTELYRMAQENGWLDGRGWDAYTTTRSEKHHIPVMRNDVMTQNELLTKYTFVLGELKRYCGKTEPG